MLIKTLTLWGQPGWVGRWGDLWASLHSEVKKGEEGDCENSLRIIDSFFCKQSTLTLRPGGAYLWKGFEKKRKMVSELREAPLVYQ